MPKTLTFNDQLVVETCPTCHVAHAFPESLYTRAKDRPGPTGHTIYCPNGHVWHYVGKSDADKLRDQLEREKRHSTSLLAQRDRETARADHEAAVARGYKGALTKVKKRIGRGVCPACNRHFSDVEAHMTTQHPDYGSDHDHD